MSTNKFPKQVNVPLTAEQYELLRVEAFHARLPLAVFCRNRVVGDSPLPSEGPVPPPLQVSVTFTQKELEEGTLDQTLNPPRRTWASIQRFLYERGVLKEQC